MLYGTATYTNDSIFSILVLPYLNIVRSGADVILSWPTNAIGTGFNLQSTTNLVSPVSANLLVSVIMPFA